MKNSIRKRIYLFVSILGMITANAQLVSGTLEIHPEKEIARYDRFMLLGTNAGVFYEESHLMNLDFQAYLRDMKPGILRIPGGTWSNELYWNGNRVRISEESYIEPDDWQNEIKQGKNPITEAFDTTRYKNGKWDVDYSGYAPGFRIHDLDHHLSDFHGFTDVLFLHKFIQAFGAEAMVTINMGTGTVEMAVEWVKWTKQRKRYAREPFDVKYWEMGNELDGHWELGHALADGTTMDAAEYVRRYKKFATAIKKADPTVKVGGSVASNMGLAFIEELIKDRGAPIDFISFHAYPSRDKDTDFVKMANHAAEINGAVKRIKKWLSDYRPEEKDRIEIALTEWNIKVAEDMTTVDLTNALWSAVMLGEIAGSGLDIAIQWDMFSTTNTGGHGLFNPNDPKMRPRSQYWAMYLWGHYMEDHMVAADLQAPEYIRTYVTRDKGQIAVMIVNGSKTESFQLDLKFPGKKDKLQATRVSFSKDQYVLNTQTLLPEKSEKPEVKTVNLKPGEKLIIPPSSIRIFRFSLK